MLIRDGHSATIVMFRDNRQRWESGSENCMKNGLGEELLRCGLRGTRQRVGILDLLRSSGSHLTAPEIFRAIRRDQPRVSKKTIYEVLDSLVRAGLALCITDGAEPCRYEAAKAHHYHARCRICGKLFDVPANTDAQIRGRSPLPEGFRIEGISVTFRGICFRCRK